MSRRFQSFAVLLFVLGGPARAQEPLPTEDLRIYLPPGMDEAAVRRALEDDLDSGLAGALPLALLEALVVLDPERFGGSVREAYRRYGFLFLEDRPELPVGIVEKRIAGVRVHNYNCLACHSGSTRLPAPDGERGFLVLGAPNRTLDFVGWYGDVMARLRAEVEAETPALQTGTLGTIELRIKVTERLVDAARRGLRRRGDSLSLAESVALAAIVDAQYVHLDQRPAGDPTKFGPGRTLVQGAYRVIRFQLPPGPFAPVKPPDLFGVRYRDSLLWGGNETFPPEMDPAERIARNGLLVPWIQVHPITRKPVPDAVALLRFPRYLEMGRLLAKAAPPPASAPRTGPERARFERGRVLYETTCTPCHGRYAFDRAPLPDGSPGLATRVVAFPDSMIPLEVVGTDPSYSASLDEDYEREYARTLYAKLDLYGSRKTGAYVARPHLGLRLRAPYLHNGSVPGLEALLAQPADRPLRFLTGRRVPFDESAVGWPADEPGPDTSDPAAGIYRTDGRVPGNRPVGHPFGTDLDEADKQALIEYLKRL